MFPTNIEQRIAALEQRLERLSKIDRPQTVLFSKTNTTTVANTTTETTLLGSGVGSVALPANWWNVGRTLRLTAGGSYGYTATPTIVLRWYFNATNSLGSNVMTLTGTPSSAIWMYSALFTCRSVGASGTITGVDTVLWVYSPTTGLAQVAGGNNASPITHDTTIAQTVDFRVLWGTANAANTISCANLILEVLR